MDRGAASPNMYPGTDLGGVGRSRHRYQGRGYRLWLEHNPYLQEWSWLIASHDAIFCVYIGITHQLK